MTDAPDNTAIALVVADRLVQRLHTNPIATLAGVAGVGYVLARGIPNAVIRIAATIALRAAALEVLGGLSESATDKSGERPASPGTAPPPDERVSRGDAQLFT